MTKLAFKKATKKQSRLRLALIGPSGSGKTYSALAVGSHLGESTAVIDSERGSASKYADLFEFDALDLETFSPDTYVEAIHAAEKAGYDVLIIDSLSHAWMGADGALEQVDKAAKRERNSFAAWRAVTPKHNRMVDALVRCRCHLIVTMRSKTEYILEQDPKTKKQVPRKVGMAPIQRDGLEYEFDVVGDLDLENNFIVSKTRCSELQGQVIEKPGKGLADTLSGWLGGEPVEEPEPTSEPADAGETELSGAEAVKSEIRAEMKRLHPLPEDKAERERALVRWNSLTERHWGVALGDLGSLTEGELRAGLDSLRKAQQQEQEVPPMPTDDEQRSAS